MNLSNEYSFCWNLKNLVKNFKFSTTDYIQIVTVFAQASQTFIVMAILSNRGDRVRSYENFTAKLLLQRFELLMNFTIQEERSVQLASDAQVRFILVHFGYKLFKREKFLFQIKHFLLNTHNCFLPVFEKVVIVGALLQVDRRQTNGAYFNLQTYLLIAQHYKIVILQVSQSPIQYLKELSSNI